MLNKEEIENMKRYFNECIKKDTAYEEDLTINFIKIAKEYIEQLKSELKESKQETQQNVIKGIENAIDFTKTDKSQISKAKIEVLENILSLLKGEKE